MYNHVCIYVWGDLMRSAVVGTKMCVECELCVCVSECVRGCVCVCVRE